MHSKSYHRWTKFISRAFLWIFWLVIITYGLEYLEWLRGYPKVGASILIGIPILLSYLCIKYLGDKDENE